MAKQRFLRFSVSTALVAITIAALAFSWWTQSGMRHEFWKMKKQYAPLQYFSKTQVKINQLLSQLDTSKTSHRDALERGRMFLPVVSPDQNSGVVVFGGLSTSVVLCDYDEYHNGMNVMVMHGTFQSEDFRVVGLFNGETLIDVYTDKGQSASLAIEYASDVNGDRTPDIALHLYDFTTYTPTTLTPTMQPKMSKTYLIVTPNGLTLDVNAKE